MAEINSIDRLQFRHHSEVFTAPTLEEARAKALKYLYTEMWYQPDEGCDNPNGHSLYAEPTVLRYAIEGEEDVHIIVAIGAETNNGDRPQLNKFCIIDINKIESEIEDIWEEIERIIKMISFTALTSDTIALYSYSDENGTVFSGDVKTEATHWFDFDGEIKLVKNNILVSPISSQSEGGLFVYVNLDYDKENETINFYVSNSDGTVSKTTVELPNNYLVKGEYSIYDESLHLTMKNGEDIKVPMRELIDEWDVEGESSNTPIVLKKEHVTGTTVHHQHSDILRGDVRVDSGRSYNILERSSGGRYLYVRGHADNIRYDWNGESTTVNEALNELKNIKISLDGTNILQDRPDGFFANTTLDYISSENKLVFRTTNVDGTIHTNEIKLNSVDVPIDEIYYDARTETLIIKWRNQKGEIQTIKIPISDMIDEWEVLNPGHNVTLTKVHKTSGKDQLSADVNIYGSGDTAINDNNILEDRDHSLYVKGTADNIKYKNTTVEGALNDLDQKIDDETARAEAAEQALDDKIEQEKADRIADVDAEEARAISAETALQKEIEAHVVNEDKSINVEKRDGEKGKEAVISVNLSEQDTERPNTIRLKSDGLYNFVDLEYDGDENTLKFIKSANDSDILVEKELKLETISDIISITYDPSTEKLIIKYKSGREEKTVEIDLKDLIEEWTVSATSTVTLIKDRVTSGGPDILTAEVKICPDDPHHKYSNAIVTHENGIYAPNYSGDIMTISGDVITEKERAEAAEQALDAKIDAEVERAKAAEEELQAEIEAVSADSTNSLKDINCTNGSINVDKTDPARPIINVAKCTHQGKNALEIHSDGLYVYSYSGEIETISGDVITEKARAEEAENNLANSIAAETAAREAKDTELSNKIYAVSGDVITESIRATSAETALQTAINNEKTRAENAERELNTTLTSKIEQTATSLSAFTSISVNEEKTRAMTAEGELKSAIDSETERANAADQVLSGAIITEKERALLIESQLHDAITAETAAREAKDTELSNKIDAATLEFDDTSSIDFNVPSEEGNIVRANVKLQEGDNIIKIGQGLYASVHLSYDPGSNKIKLVTSNGEDEEIQLVGASLLEDLHYDPVNKALVITYKDATGEEHTVQFGVSELFNDWIVKNPSEGSAIELTKTIAPVSGGSDEISGRVLISNLDDNAVQIVNNGLYVSKADAEGAAELAKCLRGELTTFEKVVIGHRMDGECGSGYTYEPNIDSYYINAATSFNTADKILDSNLHRIENNLEEASAKTECVDSKSNKLYELLNGVGSSMPNCGIDTVYTPDLGSCVISAATSFMEADRMLGDQICEILEMWQSGMTCTSISNWIDDGANKRLEIDVRPSHGNSAMQTDSEIYVTGFTGDYIDPTRTEFTDTNALRIVCLQQGESGSTPDVKSLQNGIYLSNVLDCGLYYGPSDSAAKEQARAAGYIVDPYSTDENPSATDYDYNNNVRQ